MVEAKHDPWIGKRLGQGGRYQLESLLGYGSMGRVYKALDQKLSMDSAPIYRAIKFMSINLVTNPLARERFRREMQACIILQDSHIVQVLDYGAVAYKGNNDQPVELPFIVMELITGQTLHEALIQTPQFEPARAVHVARLIAAGLQAIHRGTTIQGKAVRFVHRDLKPGNVFLVHDAVGVETIKIADFGLVKFLGELEMPSLTRSGKFGGTPNYAAPEQFQGTKTLDGRADLYSLGCILYEMLTGSNPFGLSMRASTVQWMEAHLQQPPQPFSLTLNIPKPLELIVFRCLEKDPSGRFSSAGELESALRQVQKRLPGSPSISLPKTPKQPAIDPSLPPEAAASQILEPLLTEYQLRLNVIRQDQWLKLTLVRPSAQPLDYDNLVSEIKTQLEALNLEDKEIRHLLLNSRAYGSAELDWQVEVRMDRSAASATGDWSAQGPVLPTSASSLPEFPDRSSNPFTSSAGGSASAGPISALELIQAELVEFLESCLDDERLKLQLHQQEQLLSIMLNRPADHGVNFGDLAQTLSTQVQALQLPGVKQLALYSRPEGTDPPDWTLYFDLTQSPPKRLERSTQPAQPTDQNHPPTGSAGRDAAAPVTPRRSAYPVASPQAGVRSEAAGAFEGRGSAAPQASSAAANLASPQASPDLFGLPPGLMGSPGAARSPSTPDPPSVTPDPVSPQIPNSPHPVEHPASAAPPAPLYQAATPPAPANVSLASVELPDTSDVENEESPILDPDFVSDLDLSKYCFVRNRYLLRTSVVPPSPDLSQLILFFHEMADFDKAQLLPVLADFFKDPSRTMMVNLPAHLDSWLLTLARLNDERLRTVALWLSRYCANPSTTLTELTHTLQAAMAGAQHELSLAPESQSPDQPDSQAFSTTTSNKERILYRTSSHWMGRLNTVLLIGGQLLGLAIAIPSSLSTAILTGMGLADLPIWVTSIGAMIPVLILLWFLTCRESFKILLTASRMSVDHWKRFRATSFSLQLIDIEKIQIDYGPIGQTLRCGAVTIYGQKIPTHTFRAIADPAQLKSQIKYLREQLNLQLNLQQQVSRESQHISAADKSSVDLLSVSGISISPDAWTGLTLGEGNRYRLESILGEGGMGKVYRAMDQKLSIFVAIKFMLHGSASSQEERERFQREMQACLGLQDSRIVRVLDYGITANESGNISGLPFLVMEYVTSPTLDQVLERHRRLDVRRVVNIAQQIAAALHVVHTGVLINNKRVHFVHRDLKPSNVFLLRDAVGQETIKLGDFGLVKYQGEGSIQSLSRTGDFRGTVNYAAPEQCEARKSIDRRADIYSLGCMLYEMLSGLNAFGLAPNATLTQWLYAHVHTQAKPFPESLEIPPVLSQIVLQCLDKNPDQRFNTALDLHEALASVLAI